MKEYNSLYRTIVNKSLKEHAFNVVLFILTCLFLIYTAPHAVENGFMQVHAILSIINGFFLGVYILATALRAQYQEFLEEQASRYLKHLQEQEADADEHQNQ